MPPLIRNVTFAQAVAVLQRFGYRQVRQTGSHVRMVNAAGNEITLTNHGSHPIHPGTMGRTLAQAGINPDHFLWGLGRAPRGWRPGQPD